MTNLEDALSISELEILDDMVNPITNHAHIDNNHDVVANLYSRIQLALRRAKFHCAVATHAD